MLEKFSFYFRHSLNDLWVNKQRTFFALLCIAAGVAAIVSLQTVAVMIGDTLTGNLQETNRGDIQVTLNSMFVDDEQEKLLQDAEAVGSVENFEIKNAFTRPGATLYAVGAGGLKQIQAWIDANYAGQAVMTSRWVTTDQSSIFLGGGTGTSVSIPETGKQASSVTPTLIDPKVYPFYGHIASINGTPLADLVKTSTDIIIDQKLATTLGAKEGDIVRVNGAEADFTVRGIVPTEAEVTDPFSAILAAQFGFYYLPQDAIQYFTDLRPRVQTIYLQLIDPAKASEVNSAFRKAFPFLGTQTVDDLKAQNQKVSEQTNQLVTIMGLVSLLLGSIGIVNTMQVIVRRRTVEVAVLKTIGLQAGQVTLLFLTEAFIMGVLGSILGIVLGWVTTLVIKGVAESLVAQPLSFRIALMPALNGFVVGVLVTTIFGFLPTLAAGQVRPGVVLRPNDAIVPKAGRVRTLLALVVIILILSGVASTIIGSFQTAFVATLGAFIAAGFMLLFLSFLIWLVARFMPAFGIVDMKISLRQILAARGRAAITLLALVVGVFALSLITLFADSINNLLAFSLSSGGNVIVTAAAEPMVLRVEEVLASQPGVKNYLTARSFAGTLVALQETDGTTLDVEQLKKRINERIFEANPMMVKNEETEARDFAKTYLESMGSVDGRPLNHLPDRTIVQGRQLTEADAKQTVMVITNTPVSKAMGLEVGDKLVYQFGEGANAQTVTFEIVGVADSGLMGPGLGGGPQYAPLDAFPAGMVASSNQVLVDIEESQIPELRRQLSTVPGTFVLETAAFTKLLKSLLGTFTAFPVMVALLGLIVGGVVIANSVALSTMERRQEIAIMKAVGLQRERVLGMLLLENAIMGFIGGLMGVGIGLAALVILLGVSGAGGGSVPYGTALLLMLLCIGVALVAAVTTAWGASGEKPLNVLRYE